MKELVAQAISNKAKKLIRSAACSKSIIVEKVTPSGSISITGRYRLRIKGNAKKPLDSLKKLEQIIRVIKEDKIARIAEALKLRKHPKDQLPWQDQLPEYYLRRDLPNTNDPEKRNIAGIIYLKDQCLIATITDYSSEAIRYHLSDLYFSNQKYYSNPIEEEDRIEIPLSEVDSQPAEKIAKKINDFFDYKARRGRLLAQLLEKANAQLEYTRDRCFDNKSLEELTDISKRVEKIIKKLKTASSNKKIPVIKEQTT